MVGHNTDLPVEAYVSSPPFPAPDVLSLPSPDLGSDVLVTSPDIPLGKVSQSKPLRYRTTKRTGTLAARYTNSIAVIPLQARSVLGDWRLKLVLVVRVQQVRRNWLATTWLERDLEEFGTGDTVDEAIQDLIDSIGEASEVLERRRAGLADSAIKQLDVLNRFVERAT